MKEFRTSIVDSNVVLTSGFRVPERPNHHGIDLGARPRGNPPILALNDGTVTLLQRNNPTAGNWLEITGNDGLISTYMHLDTIAPGLAQGGRVGRGQRIGTMGTTGLSTGIHLHFELRRTVKRSGGVNAIDPMPFVEEVEEMRYRTVADMPKKWAQPVIRRLIEIGVISGTGEEHNGELVLDMTHDMMRSLIFAFNMVKNRDKL